MVRAGLNAARLAERTGRSKGYISELRSGKKERPSIEIVEKFAEVLGVSLEWLFNGGNGEGTSGGAIAESNANPKETGVGKSTHRMFADFAGRLSKALEKAGIRPSRLEELAGLEDGAVDRMLAGAGPLPDDGKCRAIATATGVPAVWLTEGDETTNYGGGTMPRAEPRAEPLRERAREETPQAQRTPTLEETMVRIANALERLADQKEGQRR